MRKNLFAIIVTVLTIPLLSGCQIISNFTDKAKYGAPSEEFMNYLMKRDYDKCVSLMDISRTPNTTELKAGLNRFRTNLANDFGENLSFSFMGSADNKPGISAKPGTKIFLIQLSNQTELGVVEAIFDAKSDKIADIMALKIRDQVPNRTDFWVFGFVCLLVPIFNLFVIRKVMRSNMANKWLYYFIVIVLNIGAIGCIPVKGLVFNLYKMEPILGFDYLSLGLMGSSFIMGVPVGGIYVLWTLKKGDYKKVDTVKAK